MFLFVLILFLQSNLFSLEELPKDLKFSNQEYIVRLTTGDVLRGFVLNEIDDKDNGIGIKFQTTLGIAPIYLFEIDEIIKAEKYNKHLHRYFILPSAEGIGDNYFIGVFELGFIYAGAGITDYFSITAGRSIIPFIGSQNQISVINLKGTFFNKVFKDEEGLTTGAIVMAGGANFSWVNDANRLRHYFAVATFKGKTSRISANLFYKNSGEDLYTLNFGQAGSVGMNYADGKMGIGLGLEDQLWNWRGVNILMELWNGDFSKPTNTGVLLGFRLFNTKFSTDFGLVFFTAPFAAPFVNFVFTPF